ncbi:MAG: hypothetical protein A3F84_06850 [Candidatus Handelsmanbacteria bacterium RIFCSPLOWO2_12_FULL_64_10]|uniref:Sialidase domain-containing protein n=1 Tax=Handelsmanbacteria sp. (strain RIFCSPLOWO2_12_FULL_64_10) TaxID=1817868 RepID=A0A1F6CPT8_HANXR|nr:MAG: hypothetical protein A3F84_06850 [Candidatus Handelsmanbacteria bacterium RIFCSPLOWO2_12_FULL_64_10]
MDSNFEQLIRSKSPEETLFLHFGSQFGRMIELKDGTLLNILHTQEKRLSSDGGVTWTEPEPLLDAEGNRVGAGNPGPFRLKSGGIGMVYDQSERAQFERSVWFTRSGDEGRAWSRPVRVSEPYNNVVFYQGAVVASSGRIVVPVYGFIGGVDPVYHAVEKQHPQRGRALFGDRWAVVGHHDYESMLCFSWAYTSDDEGETWHRNVGKRAGGGGGEMLVNLDYTAGGHHACEEPVAVETSPGRLLMLLRTPLGRFYQAWSQDDGTTWTMPEPAALASSRAPAALGKVPGTDDLLILWNQASAEEIQRGRQRLRLSSAVSKDGGATWRHRRNVFNSREGDVTCVEPPPIQCYRSAERSPRLPPDDIEATYPTLAFWQDRAIITYGCRERSYMAIDEGTGWVTRQGVYTTVCTALPISWFYAR